MKYRPRPMFTTFEKPNADADLRLHQQYEEYIREFVITCTDDQRLGQLQLKLEEYVFRIQTSVNPRVVRDAICKIAVIDKIVMSEDKTANYFDILDYAVEGLELYGADVLIGSHEESDEFMLDFDSSFKTIRAYIETGNQDVHGGRMHEL